MSTDTSVVKGLLTKVKIVNRLGPGLNSNYLTHIMYGWGRSLSALK